MSNEDLKHYQQCCLIIADEVDRICKKHNITYSLISGSLLGAVRHQGFIPWDDDMDIGMLREDYEKFISICKNELDDKFHILNWDTDKDFPFGYTKITLKGTTIEEDFARKNAKYSEIFIDIFPFDKLPLAKNVINKIQKKASLYKNILWIKKGYGKCLKQESFKQRVKYNAFRLFALFIPYNYIKSKRINLYKKYSTLDYDKCYIGDYEWPKSFNRGYKKCNTFDLVMPYSFSGKSYYGFEESDKYLSVTYSDYMTLPDKKDRYNHSIKNINFGEY